MADLLFCPLDPNRVHEMMCYCVFFFAFLIQWYRSAERIQREVRRFLGKCRREHNLRVMMACAVLQRTLRGHRTRWEDLLCALVIVFFDGRLMVRSICLITLGQHRFRGVQLLSDLSTSCEA